MFRPLTSETRSPNRSGALLIAVLGLLTLFAIFALFFVFYADAEATGARIAREKEATGDVGPPDDYAKQAFNFTMRSILFDDFDIGGVLNPLRGHSLARSMYGFPGAAGASAPFSGLGTFHESAPHGADRALWINFTTPFNIPSGPQAGTYFLDPEWTGFRTAVQLGLMPSDPSLAPKTFIPKNAPYTYPDLKDLILASLSPATGEVLVKSLHRDWLFNPSTPGTQRLAPWDPNNPITNTNTDWVTPEGRTRILRPRPIDQLTAAEINAAIGSPAVPALLGGLSVAQKNNLFNLIYNRIATGQIIAYPSINADQSFTGDVQNLQGSVGQQRNDSILIDIGLPPRQWNGKWIKPLAAILLTDLDGYLNLNAHGNMRGSPTPNPIPPPIIPPPNSPGRHNSFAGYGPNEVNLGKVLGDSDALNVVMARYGVARWQPNTYYLPGAVVVNYGNFYYCANPLPVPPGPPPGWQSGAGPGPTASYQFPAFFTDGSVQWSDVSISLARNGKSSLNYNRTGESSPAYSQFNFDAGGNNPSFQLPSFVSGTAFTTNPMFSNVPSGQVPQDSFDDGAYNGGESYNKYFNHPLLFNTADWPAGTPFVPFNPFNPSNKRTYPLSDLKRLSLRYATDRDWYSQTDLARFNIANASLIGSTPPGNNYRLDQAHRNRGLVTSISTNIDSGSLMANQNTSVAGPGTMLALLANQFHPQSTAYTGTFAGGTGTDYNGPQDLRNPKSLPASADPRSGILGPIDLNRPLTDYRTDASVPLGQPSVNPPGDTTNTANYIQAWVDRHNLARDILGRLILATGANATVFTQTTSGPPPVYQPGDILINAIPGTPDYNAIRYLAQLAVNMVDAIDNDDISTGFAWNPGSSDPTLTPNTIISVDAITLPKMVLAGTALNPTGLVFGVEKPRLVINEAIGEITNNPNEGLVANTPAQQNAVVRFYVELKNPTSSAYAAGTGPLGTGAVSVYNGTFSPYQLQITQVNGGVSNALTDPANTTGTVPSLGANQSLTFDFTKAMTAAQRTIQPVGTAPAVPGPYAPANGSPGFALIGASKLTAHTSGGPVEFYPDTTMLPYSQMIEGDPLTAGGATTRMEYDFGSKPAEATLENANNMQSLRRHMVLLRRLANPYRQPGPDNPYITVDVMDYVPAYDAVVRGGGATDKNDRMPKAAAGVTTPGFEGIDGRYSVGKVQPYAGLATPGNVVPNDLTEIGTFPKSMVIRQAPNPANTGQPQHTFYRMNGRNAAAPTTQTYTNTPASLTVGGTTDTLMAPFDWFVHFDRPIVNQLELLSLQATKPHEVTQFFLQPPAMPGGPIRRGFGHAPWLGTIPVGQPNAGQPSFDPNGVPVVDTVATPFKLTNNGLYRAFDVLRVKPWTYGTALGGKVHGKININTIQDRRILQAFLDSQPGNSFNPNDVDQLWTSFITGPAGRTALMSIRTLADSNTIDVPFPSPTIHDLPGTGTDRPFLPFGAPELSPDGTNSVLVARAGAGIQDTMFRVAAPWASATFYSLGQRIANNGNVYICTGAGMSLPGPTGTGNNIIDGGVTWNFSGFAGQPLLWPATPAPWTTLTPYPTGQRVVNGPNAYICLIGGTSGPAPGPAGFGASSDGTATWSYYGSSTPQPYLQAEMARKMFNNTTTTSNAFAITVTIVFHEVRLNGVNMMSVNEGAGNRFLIGKEAYKDVPGDLRQQFYAVVDRSNLGLDPTAVPWSPMTAYPVGQLVLNGPYSYRSLNAGISGAVGSPGPTGTGTAISDGAVVWGISSALQRQPYSAALDVATSGAAPGQLIPIVVADPTNVLLPLVPPGFLAGQPGSYNIYLSNSVTLPALGPNPYTTVANPFTATVYADGKPIVIGTNSVITIGVGASRELTPFRVNYVNQDGSLNVGGPGFAAPSKPHAPGELVSNYTLGNPGIEPLFDYRNTFLYSAVVPYAKRVK